MSDNDVDHAVLYQWAAKVSGIAFEMVIPAVAGFGLDRLCGTLPILTILGAIFGMALGFWQLVKIAQIGLDKSSETKDNKAV